MQDQKHIKNNAYFFQIKHEKQSSFRFDQIFKQSIKNPEIVLNNISANNQPIIAYSSLCLVLFIIVFKISIQNRFQFFFQNISNEKNTLSLFLQSTFVLFSSLMLSLVVFTLLIDLVVDVKPLFVIYFWGLFCLFFGLKTLLSQLITFNYKLSVRTKEFIEESRFIILKATWIALPFTIFYFFANFQGFSGLQNSLIFVGFGLLFLFCAWLFIRTSQHIRQKEKVSLYHIFLYLCCLEFLPIAVIAKFVAQLC